MPRIFPKVMVVMQDTRALHGAEIATLRLVQGLAAAGVAVRVLLLRETRMGAGASPLAEALRRSLPVEEIPVAGRYSREAVAAIREAVSRERADILHSTGYKADWHAGLASHWGRDVPLVSTVHGWLFRWNLKERLFQALNLHALRRFDRVIVLCGFYEAFLRRRGFHPLQIARIPTGVKADEIATRDEARAREGVSGEPFVLGTLGRLSAEKNHELLLCAADRLSRDLDASPRPWRILIAGEGDRRAAIQRVIHRRGLADRIELAGRMAPADFFRKVDVLVQCSRVENQPLSILEAMAWMRPVIATRAGGMPEMVCDGETGRLVRRGNVRELATAMKEYIISPERARGDGVRGRDRLEREYPFERMIEDHIGLYAAAVRD